MAEPPDKPQNDFTESFLQIRKDLVERVETNLERGSRIARDLDKTLISLSAGALVFSMTFTNSLAPARHILWVLFASWAAFVTSILSLIFAIRAVQNAHARAMDNLMRAAEAIEHNKPLYNFLKIPMEPLKPTVTQLTSVGRLNNVAIIAFLIGILLLGVFVGYNLWLTPVK